MENITFVLVEWREFKRAEVYSLGLNYIQAALEQENIDVHTLISNAESSKDLIKRILLLKPQVVALKFYTETASQVFEIARELKKADKDILIAVGGHTATLYRSAILLQEKAIDIVCNGEGEYTYIDLCRRIQNKEDLYGCHGITFRDGKLIFSNPQREQVNLEESSFPDYKIFEQYKSDKTNIVEMAISSTRGCNGNCYFCVVNRVYQANGRKHWRGMSAKKIVQEIVDACSYYNSKKVIIKFLDSSIEDPDPVRKDRLIEMLELLEKENLNISFSFFTRAETWSEDDIPMIRQLKNVGLYKVYMGFDESIHPYSIHEFTDKMIVPKNRRANQLFTDEGIVTTGYLLMFQPFVTLKQLKNVAEFIDEVGMSPYPDVWTQRVILYPDTKLYYLVVEAGLLLGLSEDGYSYHYAYEDGRIEKLQNFVCRIQKYENYNLLRTAMMKNDNLIEQYSLLNNRDNTEEIMETYQKAVKEIYEDLGRNQKMFFLEAIEEVQNDNEPDELMQQWNELLIKKQKELEDIWFRTRFALARKGLVIR